MKVLEFCLGAIVLAFFASTSGAFQSSRLPLASFRSFKERQHPMEHREVLLRPTHPRQQPSSSSTSLNALAALASPIGSIGVLATVVCIHEAGHYFAAKAFGMKVDEFSVGVGPQLFKFERFGNMFSLRLLPLGGYVKFPENYNSTLVREQEQAIFDAERDAMGNPPLVSRLLNIVTFGKYQKDCDEAVAKAQMELDDEERARPWWKKALGVLSKKELSSETDPSLPGPSGDFDIEYYDDPDLLQNRPWPQRAVVIAGGVIFNIILAWAIYFGEIGGKGLNQPTFQNGAVIAQAPKAESAAIGRLRKDDVIVGFEGSYLSSKTGLTSSLSLGDASQSIDDFIKKIRATEPGDEMSLQILRDGKEIDVTVKPKGKEVGSFQSLGVQLSPNFKENKLIKSESTTEAAALATDAVTELTTQITKGVLSLIKMATAGQSPGSQIAGPIGLIKEGSNVVSTSDAAAVGLFAAAISLNLAVVNSLPLPALDGGQMVFILWEAVTRRKVNQQVQEELTGFAFLLLLLLTISTTFGDISKLIGN